MQLSIKKTNKTMGGRSKQRFLHKKIYRWLKAHEKMLNISNYYRNANEIALHTCHIGRYKNFTNNRGYREKGTLLHCRWEFK